MSPCLELKTVPIQSCGFSSLKGSWMVGDVKYLRARVHDVQKSLLWPVAFVSSYTKQTKFFVQNHYDYPEPSGIGVKLI